jgi:hypothetical protein
MTTVICDKCGNRIVVGFLCREQYLGENHQDKMQWLMQQQNEEKAIHICRECMRLINGKGGIK